MFLELLSIVLSSSIIQEVITLWGGKQYLAYLSMKGSIWGHIPKIVMILFVLYIQHKKFWRKTDHLVELWGAFFSALLLPTVFLFAVSRILNFYLPLRLVIYSEAFCGLEQLIKPEKVVRIIVFLFVLVWMVYYFSSLKTQSGIIPYIIKEF